MTHLEAKEPDVLHAYVEAAFVLMRDEKFRELDRRCRVEADKFPGSYLVRNTRAILLERMVGQILAERG